MKPVLLIDFGSTYTKLTAVDVEGEAKKKLTEEDLLKLFAQASGREFASDRAILS